MSNPSTCIMLQERLGSKMIRKISDDIKNGVRAIVSGFNADLFWPLVYPFV